MNKKMLISIALLFVMILNCFVPVIAYTDAAANGDVEITLNSNLYEAIKRSLVEQKIVASYNDAQRTITMSQEAIANVTYLNLSNGEIDDLEGLDVFANLTSVDLSANKLTKDSSLEVLSGMPLEYLDLSSNEIEDIIKNVDYSKVIMNDETKEVFLTDKNMMLDLGSIAKGYVYGTPTENI